VWSKDRIQNQCIGEVRIPYPGQETGVLEQEFPLLSPPSTHPHRHFLSSSSPMSRDNSSLSPFSPVKTTSTAASSSSPLPSVTTPSSPQIYPPPATPPPPPPKVTITTLSTDLKDSKDSKDPKTEDKQNGSGKEDLHVMGYILLEVTNKKQKEIYEKQQEVEKKNNEKKRKAKEWKCRCAMHEKN